MTVGLVWQVAFTFVSVAFLSIGGGSTLIPEFHRQIVEVHGWLSNADFAHVVTLAQIAPGPNMLVVSLLGLKIAGISGLLASTVAIVGPPSVLALFVGRMAERLRETHWLGAVKRALAPCVVGLTLASGLITAQVADNDWVGILITAAAAMFMFFLKRNPLWVIAGGALAGIAAHRLGVMSIV
ncbi:MAG: hypothetical protein BGP04_09310 [Rhizobiales bacterium 62-17]|nr:chromate transporter [Hyphomicrobiales bacterium]OJY05553.1 MAG: hypothetical protein BGP04_09310 [Rhizobiales bacterium 62-17]